jgi:hypothetical protein
MKKERIFIISNAKADLFKEYCRQLQIDTITTAYDEKNRYFSCLMTDQELSEAKAFCDMWCRPERKENPCLIYIIIEETRILL